MTNFYLIAYYKIKMEGHYSILENGKVNIKSECTGTNYLELAKRVKQERDMISPDIPTGFINMVPDNVEDPDAKRFSHIHEKTIMQTLFED